MDILRRIHRKIRKYVVPHKENEFRPIFLRAGGLLVITLFILATLFASNVQRFVLKTSDFLASILPAVLVDLANADRAGESLAFLKVNPLLEEAARLKAADMAAKSYFAHYSPEGVSPWHWIAESGYGFVYAGENLAVNFDDSDAVNTAWMNSPGHRANILNSKFTEIGIATQKGIYQGKETLFVVQMFGTPAKTPALTPTPTAPAPDIVEDTPELVPLTSSSVLGESESQIFIAVENKNAELVVLPADTSEVSYSNFTDKILASPTKMLALTYSLLAIVLGLIFIFVVKVKHAKRGRHVLYILLLLILIFGLFYFYQAQVETGVELPLARSERNI